MPLLSIANLILIFTVIVAIQYCRSAFRKGLRELPGPLICRFTRLWKFREALGGASHLGNIELHRKYGRIVRVGPNHVSVNDPAEIPIIYGIHSEFRKADFYTVFASEWEDKPFKDLFTLLSPAEHKTEKRNVSNAYAMSSMLAFEPMVDDCIQILIDRLVKLQKTGAAIDLGEWMQWYAFDVIGGITFSWRFGFMEQEKDVNSMIGQIDKGFAYASVVGQLPEMHKVLLGNCWVKLLFKSVESLRKLNPIFCIVPFTEEEITNHSLLRGANGNGPIDFLSRLIEQQKAYPDRLTDFDVLTHCSDTTAIALRAALYMLIKNPRCYAKVQAEIDELDKKRVLGPRVTFAQSLEMPYLQAVMKEAMRLHPSVGFGMDRYIPAGGATICGHYLPAGTIVSMNAWAVHQNKQAFGDDAQDFRPERWIESDEEAIKRMNRAFLAFGAGTRTCIGKNISILEMSKVIPQLLRKFRIELESPEKEWKVENYWFARQSDFICRLKPNDTTM